LDFKFYKDFISDFNYKYLANLDYYTFSVLNEAKLDFFQRFKLKRKPRYLRKKKFLKYRMEWLYPRENLLSLRTKNGFMRRISATDKFDQKLSFFYNYFKNYEERTDSVTFGNNFFYFSVSDIVFYNGFGVLMFDFFNNT
jgi:hypothetical protein